MSTRLLLIIFVTSHDQLHQLIGACDKDGQNVISVPLLDQMKATLKADIDVSKMNEYFKDYIQQEVQKGIKLAIVDLMQAMVNKTEHIQIAIEQNIKDQETKEFSSFSSRTTYDGLLSSAPIKYDKVLTNIGNDYDAGSGIFTAPVTGLYCISFSMMGFYSSNGVYIFLMKNQSEFTRLYTAGSGRHEVTSNTVFINLSKDDTVWVKGYAGKKLYAAEPYNMFSGTLIRSGSF